MIPNLDFIKELSNGDLAFEQKFINILKQEFPLELEEYQSHIDSAQFDEAAMNVHKLKHKLSILGLMQDYELAIKHEEALLNGDAQWKNDFLRTLEKVDDFIKNI